MPSALVTGSARGIGKALVLALAEQGYDVAIHYRFSEKEARKVRETAVTHGGTCVLLKADVSRPLEAQRLVHQANERLGGLDVLVNNVGNYHYGPLDELANQTWHEMFDSNLHSTFYTCQTAVPIMREAGGGRIINIGYAGAEIAKARPLIAPYAIAKSAMILYSRSLAKTVAGDGITVNVISPGVMENSVTQPIDKIPMGRTGRLSEVVAAALYLLSPAASYITGVTLEVAGGWNL